MRDDFRVSDEIAADMFVECGTLRFDGIRTEISDDLSFQMQDRKDVHHSIPESTSRRLVRSQVIKNLAIKPPSHQSFELLRIFSRKSPVAKGLIPTEMSSTVALTFATMIPVRGIEMLDS
ncbi:hypothetical protein AAE478_005116 [Parahypoxylon ruwenzoriense]